ncbi:MULTISPECIES: hypothetical protein [Bradyrhizobium]|uniref:Uncharacterized protein n=1 Tax=Bradyrhizobium ottawaense TaxID=931866 RepID=A0ABV4FQA7_9BRAD|nr:MULTISPECIES: hypothetical protein [Bradyrhizobium]MBR1292829.1 hypothetical protein [Bradyrhizobium ottawaense]MBR1335313.1 hypothetical protein [Bradyrhizobium ottawaense]MDT4738362.1 hypothetical protein [Bradyrhizobium sp. WYCCWR 12699]WLA74247.1 hypothetical protein QIH77_03150 [Bradyrhizobium diazoefficiens]WLB45943.1 hypothetical protein QIH93_36635 [Bradyrhizobium ottawaense]
MPIIRYFVFVGGFLLALLFAADRYLPAPVEAAAVADPDRTIIRIKSARSLPEKIVFDTSQRAEVPMIAQADPIPEELPREVREAMAAMPAAPSGEARKEEPAHVAAVLTHPKRSAMLRKRTPDRRLAFERADATAGGSW